MRVEEPPPTAPVEFVNELAELQRGNHDLRSQLHSEQVPKNERANSQEFVEFHCRLGAHKSFAFGLHGEWDGVPLMSGGPSESSARKETLIESAEACLRSNRFNSLSC